jgi:glycosyltransferase involved in cell wall biosynthesis
LKVALATWFPANPDTPKGGVEAVSVNLARALSRLDGLDVHVVTLDPGVTTPQIDTWENVTVHRLPQAAGSLLTFATGAGRRLLQQYLLKLQPDVVHAHDTFGIMTTGLALPRVFTIHGFIHEDTRYKGGWKAYLRSLAWKSAELDCWKEQPHIVSICPYVRERLRGIATGVIHDIENPIAAECFEVVRAEQPGTIFSAAVICQRKNTLGLVQAFAEVARRHPAVRLRLAGPVIEPVYGEAVQRCIQEAGLQDRVDLLGSVSAADIRRELSRASVFALVSFEEGAPMGVAEAMAAGLPVVTSNRCGMPYMVRNGESGFLVNPEDTADVAGKLAMMLHDAPLRGRMGAEARAAASRSYHPNCVAAKTYQVYREAGATSQS